MSSFRLQPGGDHVQYWGTAVQDLVIAQQYGTQRQCLSMAFPDLLDGVGAIQTRGHRSYPDIGTAAGTHTQPAR